MKKILIVFGLFCFNLQVVAQPGYPSHYTIYIYDSLHQGNNPILFDKKYRFNQYISYFLSKNNDFILQLPDKKPLNFSDDRFIRRIPELSLPPDGDTLQIAIIPIDHHITSDTLYISSDRIMQIKMLCCVFELKEASFNFQFKAGNYFLDMCSLKNGFISLEGRKLYMFEMIEKINNSFLDPIKSSPKNLKIPINQVFKDYINYAFEKKEFERQLSIRNTLYGIIGLLVFILLVLLFMLIRKNLTSSQQKNI